MRDSFTIYRSVYNALKAFPPEYMKDAFIMIGEYAMDGKEPDASDGVSFGLFCTIKPLIDSSIRKSEAGRRGGEANGSKLEANQKQTRSKSEANGSKPEANKKEEIRKEKVEIINNKNTMSGKPAAEYQYKAVIDYLNQKTGKAFKDKSKDTRRLIKARFDEGYTLEDFMKVIDNKVSAWAGDPKMDDFLRPGTLFSTKFEGYLNEQPHKQPVQTNNRFNNFEGRSYDYSDLERQLLGV